MVKEQRTRQKGITWKMDMGILLYGEGLLPEMGWSY
jgi:hypothetical protein